MNAPYSKFDSKGRCVRHPSVQMCRKKLGGGWKTLTSICAMCAMEPLSLADDDDDVRQRRGQPSRRPSYDALAISNHEDRSVGHSVNDLSVLSAPPTYHRTTAAPRPSQHQQQDRRRGPSSRRPISQDQGHCHRGPIVHLPSQPPRRRDQVLKKLPSNGSDLSQDSGCSSCDLTADMYAADVMSYGSHSASSCTSSSVSRNDGDRRGSSASSPPASVPRNLPVEPADEGACVCGMEYEHGTYYTGQVDVRTRLPHGLGTLRRGAAGGRVLLEGEWHYGALIAPAQPRGGHPESFVDDDDAEQCCLPTTDDEHDDDDEDDDDVSSISSSPTESTSSPRSSFTRSYPAASYSARESKPSPLPPQSSSYSSGSIAINGTRATFDRLQDYERYVDRCDEEGDWYHPNDAATAAACVGDYDRVRRVRFLCDP